MQAGREEQGGLKGKGGSVYQLVVSGGIGHVAEEKGKHVEGRAEKNIEKRILSKIRRKRGIPTGRRPDVYKTRLLPREGGSKLTRKKEEKKKKAPLSWPESRDRGSGRKRWLT